MQVKIELTPEQVALIKEAIAYWRSEEFFSQTHQTKLNKIVSKLEESEYAAK